MKWNLWRSALYGVIVEAFAMAIAPDHDRTLSYLMSGDFEAEFDVFARLSAGPLIFVLIALVHNRFVKRERAEISK